MFQVIMTADHQNEGLFPTFVRGTAVTVKEPSQDANWVNCEIEGLKTYIYKYLIADSRLLVDYNPTELDVAIGDSLEVIAIYGVWLHAIDTKRGKKGWVPAEKVKSVPQQ